MNDKQIKNAAYYQKLYRDRLKEQGLVKKELWILPEYVDYLSNIEKQLRQPKVAIDNNIYHQGKMEMTTNHSVQELYESLQKTELVVNKHASIEVINGVDECLHIIMHEYGDLPIFLSMANQQIVVESLLWGMDKVKNSNEFNEEILCSRKLFPLSTIAIERTGDGYINYIMYGSLNSASLINNIVFELKALADNVIKATELYSNLLDL